MLDSDSKTDGLPDWEVLDVCLADHSGSISHIHATLSVTINGLNILIPMMLVLPLICPDGMRCP